MATLVDTTTQLEAATLDDAAELKRQRLWEIRSAASDKSKRRKRRLSRSDERRRARARASSPPNH